MTSYPAEQTAQTAQAATRGTGRPPRRSGFSRLLHRTGYVFGSFWLAIIAVPVLWALFGVGFGMSFAWIGIPVLAICAATARGFALTHRRMIRATLGRDAASPVYRRHSSGNPWRRAFTTLGDAQTWLDLGHGLFGFIPATVAFSVLFAWWAVALGGLSWVVWGWSLPRGPENHSLPELMGIGSGYAVELVFYTALGLFFAATLPTIALVCSWIQAGPALLMLSGRANLQQEIEYQVRGRQAARTAEAGALRRLERDIHDGPQQRLVRLGMDLGLAKRQVSDNPDRAQELIDEAIGQARATLDELRSLSRGIAPPVLADRGLRAALEEVVARSTIPVHLTMDGLPELPDHVETAVYFVISEALVNVAKHSRAEYAVVTVSVTGALLTLTVTDNGMGGATLAKGHGLVGLSDRVRSVDGVLNLSSPVGGPTELIAEIPCAS